MNGCIYLLPDDYRYNRATNSVEYIDKPLFYCSHCRYYAGNLDCKQGVMIMAVGIDMSNCLYYQHERRQDEK